MASVVKFTQGAVYNQLRHNLRQIAHSGNPDIDPARLRQDYVLSPDQGHERLRLFPRAVKPTVRLWP